jgi:hypothetical protein
MFRQGDAGGTIQFFFDLTAMETLYGPGGPSLGGGWNPEGAHIGSIDQALTFSMYNSNTSYVNGSEVVIGPVVVPEPTSALLCGIAGLGFLIRRRR